MQSDSPQTMARGIYDALRLKTLPVAVKFTTIDDIFPDKTRFPATALKKRITICQAVSMVRLYGWTVGLTRNDLICVPAMLAFGFTAVPDPVATLAGLFCEVAFVQDAAQGEAELKTMYRLDNAENRAIVMAPWTKALFEPDCVLFYANPAQIMRMVQAVVYAEGVRIVGHFGGKVECTEYLLAPHLTGRPRIAMPGMGDRIFSMTQDDEMVLSLPAASLPSLYHGLENAGKSIGARYPVTSYQNFQPEFPKPYQKLGKELELF